MQHQRLVLFTSDFPFGTGETFLETEIEYLAKGFGEVLILSSNVVDESTRKLPDNCKVERFSLSISGKDKITSLFQLFSLKFWEEKKIIQSVYRLKLSKGILSTMLISLYRAKKVERKVEAILSSNQKVQPIFYSYWCDDVALGLALASEKHPEISSFCRIHRWDVYFDQSAVGYLPFRHYITAQLKAIFSISQDGIDYAQHAWKTGRDEKFQLSRLGIQNDAPLKNVERDYFLLVSCSNLIPVKRVHLIAQALQLITTKRIQWVHIGDGPERGRIEKEIVKLPQNIRVELKGRVPNKEIYTFYDEVRPDLFINVSASEGVPVSIMEAMSFGIPVIATNVGGNGEIVDEENGVLIPVNENEELIKDKLEAFFSLDANNKRINAFKTWAQKYKASHNYELFIEEIYKLSFSNKL